MSERRADEDPSALTALTRPYSFTEDIRRVWRIPPPATLILVLITVVAFGGQLLGGSGDWQRAVGIIPANLSDTSSFLRVGDSQILPAWLTLFSYMFLHSGVLHLLTNMACLWIFGIIAEPVIGTKRFALAYLAFGIITGVAIVAIIPHWTGPMVGTSGAISGILGVFLALRMSERIGPRRQTVVRLLLETVPLFAVAAWFVARDVPSEPDRASSAAWHLIPFLAAWYSVRIWKGLVSLGIRPKHTNPAV